MGGERRAAGTWWERFGIWAVIGLFGGLAAVYSVVVPAFETPDEIWHYAFIHHVAGGQGLPVAEPNSQALWRQQGVQAPAYYLAAAALTAWIDQADFPAVYARANPHRAIGRPDAAANRNYLVHYASDGWPWRGTFLALHLSRLFSVVLGCVTLYATYCSLLRVVEPRPALLGTGILATIPQFVFISAAASNDNAINALAALVLWRLVVLVTAEDEAGSGRSDWQPLALVGVLLGLALLSKLSGLALLGLAGLAVGTVAWRRRSWRRFWAGAFWIGAPAAGLAGWWYLRNWRLYGDPLAWEMWRANILLRVVPAGWSTVLEELGSLERSFWGLFGWLNVAYPDWVYGGLRALTVVVAAGLAIQAGDWLGRVRRRAWRPDRRWLAAGVLLLWLVLLIISWLRFMRIAPAAQGRYFFPAAPALALFLALGLDAYRRIRLPVAGPAAVALLALAVVTPWWIIRPAYRPGPGLPAPAVQEETVPVQALLGWDPAAPVFAITAVGARPAQVRPGETAIVTVGWEASAPGTVDYSVFVHLLDQEGLTVAQLDTMPGGGLLPTSQWAPGQRRVERYAVQVPATAYAPNQGRWVVGLYDHRSGQRLPVHLADGENAQGVAVAEEGLHFGSVTILSPAGPVPNPIDVAFLDNVTLLGYRLIARSLRPGQELEVTLYWQARGPISQEYTTFVHLLDADFQTHGGHDGPPSPGSLAWQAGEIVEDAHTFLVSPEAPPGIYQVEIGLYPWPSFARLPLVAAPGAEGADRVLLGPLRMAAE